MNWSLQEHIHNNLQTKPTSELMEIWEENDRREWSNEAFTAIQDILQARLGSVPPQKPPTDTPESLAAVTPRRNPITADLLGGLTLIPYGLYALLSALAFVQGWLNWQTNHGPPFLGLVVAWLGSKLINRYYRKTYNCAFDATASNADRAPLRDGLFSVLFFLCILAAWFVDARLHSPLRALPLLIGLFIVGLGIALIRKSNWPNYYSALYIGIGLSLVSLGLAPVILGVPVANPYWGLDGVLELVLGGTAAILIGVIEHHMFLKRIEMDWKNQFNY